jgi:5-hydroxyisourate hydrolase-like protein (transthyretin family)
MTVDHAVDTVNGQTGDVNLDTGDVPEGTNLYYTEGRVSANLSVLANTSKVSADGSVTTHLDVTNAGSGKIITDAERTKLQNVEDNAKDDQLASEVPFNPNGDIDSGNVQEAIVELRNDTDSKLAVLIPNYLDRHYHRDTSELVTTSTSFIDFFNINVPIAHNNKRYKITLSYIWSHDDTGNDIEVELLIDGTRVMFQKQEPQDSGGGGVGATSQRFVASYTLTQELASGNRNIQLRFRTDSSGDESTIHGADLVIERWMD